MRRFISLVVLTAVLFGPGLGLLTGCEKKAKKTTYSAKKSR